jgi:TPR repeat protein
LAFQSNHQTRLIGKLKEFTTNAWKVMTHRNDLWVESEFTGDSAALAVAAEGGDAKAQLAMMIATKGCADEDKWLVAAMVQYNNHEGVQEQGVEMPQYRRNNGTFLWCALHGVLDFIKCDGDGPSLQKNTDLSMAFLADAAAHGSATAQHVYGMTMYCNACGRESGAKADFLNAARWIREAAVQGIMEAQYELGEMFRLGLFCKVHMCFARKYIRRASRQGHVEAIVRMKELRGCVFCGADDAPLACSRCRQARYCDSTCSEKHWREGCDVGKDLHGSNAAPHKDTCPRTHRRRTDK